MAQGEKIVALMCCILLLPALCACRTLQENAMHEEDGEVVDSVVTNRVKARLLEDPYFIASTLSIETVNGEVILAGSVSHPALKKRATQVVESVQGVRKVNNLLQIK